MSTLLDIVTAPWAILPAHLDQVRAVFERHIKGEKIDLKQVEADLGRPLGSKPQGYSIQNGVAIVPMNGILAKRASALQQTSGMNSMDAIARDFRGALADPGARAIVLQIDSPGGTVDGTRELADMIFQARGIKPIVAFADGCMASAAYWIGSAADQVISSGETTIVGSIGVVATHVDVSKAEEMAGQKTTEVVAGAKKRITSSYKPLSEEGLAVLQEQVDAIHELMKADISAYRGADITPVADGSVFMGSKAQEAGLVDGVSTLDALIARLAGEMGAPPKAMKTKPGAVALPQKPTTGGSKMELTELKAEHPALVEALLAEGRTEGATAERERIQAVEAAALPGHEALIASLKFDGKSTGGDAAMAVLSAERTKRGTILATMRSEAPTPVPSAPVPPAPQPEPDANDESLSLEARCEAAWAKDSKLRAAYGGDKAPFLAVATREGFSAAVAV